MKYTDMTLEEVDTSSEHAHRIALAKDGSILSARMLMADASICLQYGVALPEPLVPYR